MPVSPITSLVDVDEGQQVRGVDHSNSTQRTRFHRGSPEAQPVPPPVLLPTLTLPLNSVVPTPPQLPTHLTPPTQPNRLPSLTKPLRPRRATVQACWLKWPPQQAPLPSARPSDTESLTCSLEMEGGIASPSNKVLPFNNNNRPSNNPESVVKPRPRVRTLSLTLPCPYQLLTFFILFVALSLQTSPSVWKPLTSRHAPGSLSSSKP